MNPQSALSQFTSANDQAAARTPTPEAGGSWWQKLLPTAGSVLGGIGGELVDPFGGGIIGAGLGGALGKAAQNATEGKAPIEGNLISSGLEGAGGQLMGGVVGKVLGKAATGIAGAANKGASSLFAGQFAKGTIDKNLANDLVQKYGINDAQHISPLTRLVTGSSAAPEGEALINKAVENGITSNSPAPHVDLSNVTGNFNPKYGTINPGNLSYTQKLLQNTQGLSPADEKKILSFVDNSYRKLPQSINGTTDNMSALQLSRAFADQGRSLTTQAQTAAGSAKTGLQASAKVYDNLASSINDEIFSPAGKAVIIPPAEKDALAQSIRQQGQNINPQAAEQIAKDVENAETYKDLRSVQAKWVVANQGLQKTENIAANNYGTTTKDLIAGGLPIAGAIAGGGKGAIAGLGAAATSSAGIDKAGSSALSGLSGLLTNPNFQKSVAGTSKAAGIGIANTPNYVSPNQPITNQLGGAMQPNGQLNGQLNGQSQGQPQAGLANGADTNNSNLVAQLDAMMTANPALAPSLAPILASLVPQVQQAGAASSALQNYIQTLGQAGGGQGPVGGLLSTLGGALTGGPAAQVAPEQSLVQQLLAKAGLPGVTLPGMGASQQGVGLGLGQTQGILSALGQ